MQELFLISGLGADRRLFNNLKLPGFELIYVDWLEPEAGDTLGTYAQKLITQYKIQSGAIVVGVSLGGMLTVEISSKVALKYAILISSIQSEKEFPWYYGLFRRVPVYKVLPVGLLPTLRMVLRPLFGLRNKAEADIFVDMIKSISPKFIKWAMHAVLHWQPPVPLAPVYRIHGNNDVVFSSRRTPVGVNIIPRGSHNMVFNRPEEVGAAILNIISYETS